MLALRAGEVAPHRRALLFAILSYLAILTFPAIAAPVAVPDIVRQDEERRVEVMRQAAPAVVAIFGEEGGGSGVIVRADGLTVTNFHVVTGLGPFMKCGLNDGKVYTAVLIGIDPTGDVALIQLLGRDDFPTARIGDSDAVRVGDMSFCMGNPFLLATDFHPTATWGMVSGVHRYQFPDNTFLEYTDCLQVDASINPGNSGGPLFNADGELIGINGRISITEARGRVNVGTGYAISINQVMNFLDHLESGRIVDHATLGATVTGTSDGTVVIQDILESSSIYRRGIRRGDELVSFAGRPIRSVNQFKNILGIYPKGWTLPISYRRDGQQFDVRVQLQGLHRRAELLQTGGNSPNPDEERDGDGPPLPLPELFQKKGPEIPEELAHLYKARPGYANYHFNEVQQQRLLAGLKDWGDYTSSKPGWQIVGQINQSVPFEARLQPDVDLLRLGANFFTQKLTADLADIPPSTGGLLPALEQLRHFLSDRGDYFTELYYVGSEPWEQGDSKVDVLVTTKVLVTCRWFFERESGRLLGFDTSLGDDVDPCQIRFGELQELGPVKFPKTMTIRTPAFELGTLAVESVKFFEPAPAEGATR